MNLMNKPEFLINKYFYQGCLETKTMDDIKKELYEQGIMIKYYEDLILVYHKYEAPVTNELQRETRSLVISTSDFKVIAYTGEVPYMNKEGSQKLALQYFDINNKQSITTVGTESYDGTLLTVFFHKKWYVSTRRCIDSNESKFNSDKSHFTLFEEVLLANGETFEQFSAQLDTSLSYYFVLLHHQAKNIIDYTSRLGDNYKSIVLISVKNSDQVEVTNFHASYNNHIVKPLILTVNDFVDFNNNVDYNCPPTVEGIIVNIRNPNGKISILKLQTNLYQFYNVTASDNNILKGLLYLYQADQLSVFLSNPKSVEYSKIINTQNMRESYDMIGTIDSVFKVCSNELFELFKNLWNIKSGEHKNITLYNQLPKEYKDVLFKIRGIYYKKKKDYAVNKYTQENANYLNSHIKISDIYNLLKTINIDELYCFLRNRKALSLHAKTSNVELFNIFNTLSYKSDKIHLKLCAIFTNKLFPNISNMVI